MSHGPQPHKWALTRELAREVRDRYQYNGWSYRRLMAFYNLSYGIVHGVVTGTHTAVRTDPTMPHANLARPRGGSLRRGRATPE